MHKVTFFPIGNADSCLIQLENGQNLLFDYAHMKDLNNTNDKRIHLENEIRAILSASNKTSLDIVAITHLDNDHIKGASDFFYLEHAEKYQGPDRIKIETLWVPAAVILEDGLEGEARILRAEARHRLKKGKGIRVFSRPVALKSWLEKNNLNLEDREHLISDAGTLLPGFSKDKNNLEIFVHSPFGFRQNEDTVIDRNSNALAVHLTFFNEEVETKLFLTADLACEAISDIVKITKYHKLESRLQWDIMNLPHHCSYLSLANEKGEEVTEPLDEIKYLFEKMAMPNPILISTSWPIPDDLDESQPPHRQAANYYSQLGDFKVTMTFPNYLNPGRLEIKIDKNKASIIKKDSSSGPIKIISQSAHRAG